MRPEFGEHSLSQNLVMGHFAGDRGDEPWQDKVSREMALFKAGWSAAEETAKESVSDDQIASTALQVLGSVGAGIVMAKLAPARGIVGFAGKSLSIGLATSFVAEVATHAKAVAGAVSDTWESNANQGANTEVVEGHLGRFLFDAALGTAGGAAGMKLGKSIFKPGSVPRPLTATELEIGTFRSNKTLPPEAQLALDTVIPPTTRTALAQRSPLYSQERALRFAHAIEKAVPNIDDRIRKGLSEVQAAQHAEFLVRTKGGGGRFSYGGKEYPASEFMKFNYNRVIPQHESVKRFNKDLEEIARAVNPVLAETAGQLGIPAPKVLLRGNLQELGAWQKGMNRMIVNADGVSTRGDFASTSYHELTHAEQTHLVIRRIADELRLPANPTAEDQALLYRAFKNWFNIDSNYRNFRFQQPLKTYISNSLKLRAGQPLSAQEETRAVELIESLKGTSSKGPLSDSNHLKMNEYFSKTKLNERMRKHLLYRTSLHEIEAWETAELVRPVKIVRDFSDLPSMKESYF